MTRDQVKTMFPGVTFSRSATGRETASISLSEPDKDIVRLCSNTPEDSMSSVRRIVAAREVLGYDDEQGLIIGEWKLNTTDLPILEI